MSIVFRCPECGHKLRAAGDVIGKQARCKCGTVIDVPLAEPALPSTDILDPQSSAWALQPNPKDAGFEPISAWSPLFSDRRHKQPAGFSDLANRRLRAILIGVAGLLAVILVVGLGAFAVSILRRLGNQEVQIANNPAEDETMIVPAPPPVQDDVPAPGPPPPVLVIKKPVKLPDAPVVPPIVVKEKKEPPLALGLALANPPGQDASEPFHAKHPPADNLLKAKDRETMEVRHWYTAPSFVVEDSPGKTRVLSLNKEAAEKLGVVLIAVQVRLPAEPLIGKEFAVLNPDARLVAAKGGPYHAIGIHLSEDIWFAPPEGQRLYPIDNSFPKAAPVQQGWLFIAPIADLNAGRISFQFKERPPLPLTARSRLADAKQAAILP